MPAFIDISGQTFSRWTVLSRAPDKKPGVARWWCRCECGTVKDVGAAQLKNGQSRSCGCFMRETSAAIGRASKGHTRNKGKALTHGHCSGGGRANRQQSRTYRSWARMRQRCLNQNSTQWEHYGGRGITICERWSMFEAFLTDMGECPANLTLERINTNGNYEPDNCKWATQKEQSNNRRNNRIIVIDGEAKTLAQWSEESGIKLGTIWARLKAGWPHYMAVFGALTPGHPPHK